MEIAFASSSLLGHLTPLIPYMEVLLERGHTITCFHDSNPQSRKKLESCGLLPLIEQAENHSSGTYNENTKSYISSVPYGHVVEKYTKIGLYGAGPIYDCMMEYYSHRNTPSVVVYDFFAP